MSTTAEFNDMPEGRTDFCHSGPQNIRAKVTIIRGLNGTNFTVYGVLTLLFESLSSTALNSLLSVS